jgi:hypothetical protein
MQSGDGKLLVNLLGVSYTASYKGIDAFLAVSSISGVVSGVWSARWSFTHVLNTLRTASRSETAKTLTENGLEAIAEAIAEPYRIRLFVSGRLRMRRGGAPGEIATVHGDGVAFGTLSDNSRYDARDTALASYIM